MLENQFIQLTSTTLADAKLRKAMLFPLDVHRGYQMFYEDAHGAFPTRIEALNESGDIIDYDTYSGWDGWMQILGGDVSDLDTYLLAAVAEINIGDTFFIHLETSENGTTYHQYSQPLVRVPLDEFAYLKYYCNEDAFGFPFKTVSDERLRDSYAALFIPIRLHSPQNVQDDKTYVKANGKVVTLYAKYYRELEGETEYLSAEMHDKIVAALSCDEVYINGKRVTKSDNYQVDWENYDLDCDGVTKLAKATFKVREHITQRNSNF